MLTGSMLNTDERRALIAEVRKHPQILTKFDAALDSHGYRFDAPFLALGQSAWLLSEEFAELLGDTEKIYLERLN